jgi:hypothetical protein
MKIDIRTPVGLMFAFVGLLLVGYGLLSSPAVYERSLGININLWWGLAMTSFGAFMLWLARR